MCNFDSFNGRANSSHSLSEVGNKSALFKASLDVHSLQSQLLKVNWPPLLSDKMHDLISWLLLLQEPPSLLVQSSIKKGYKGY